ncbi:hypothetical protein PCS_01382 [Desulfocurvibacter africanus PCS]|uniref:Cytochrome c domain-containing protein n=1 Tax=Desulfocurvibacter africanus PCS TaxID=1262666 RepID=M5Q360_DESAF|nr:hypothetical protein [Desulfocurvibacter africanus]EMG37983.1 hypothetical protein PCS_01382 [Desulfocurvibacter africanus PCS]
MKNAAKRMGLVALPILSLMVAAASGLAAAQDGRQTVENVCNRCHTHEPICQNLNRNEAWWHMTALRMINNGAPISQNQAKDAAIFLATLKPGSEPVCK